MHQIKPKSKEIIHLRKHLQIRDDRMGPEGADGPGFESFRIAEYSYFRGIFPT
jgi:hypothetical protein